MQPEIRTIRLSDVIFDEVIYPRRDHDPVLVQRYDKETVAKSLYAYGMSYEEIAASTRISETGASSRCGWRAIRRRKLRRRRTRRLERSKNFLAQVNEVWLEKF